MAEHVKIRVYKVCSITQIIENAKKIQIASVIATLGSRDASQHGNATIKRRK